MTGGTAALEMEAPPARPPAPSVKALSCPSCGGTINLKAAGYTVTVACQYCGSILDVASPEVRLITEYHQAAAELEIPLGTRGTLRDVEWEAIGFVRRSEHGAYPWVEYLLFNPYHGYRWLITNGRGWSFGEMLTRAPDWGHSGPALDGESYEPFFVDGQAQVDYVVGEFYWRVQVGEEAATDDYVRPGFMLSREANDKEVSWTISALLKPAEIEQAFGVRAPRDPWPPLPHQPSPYRGVMKVGARIALIAVGVMFLLTLLMSGGPSLFEGYVPVELDRRAQNVTAGPIEATRPYQLISIEAWAPNLENGWIDLDYALVNRATQESYEAYGVAERYSGRDSDGAWSEGSRGATTKLAAVPRGTYDLVVEYTGNGWTDAAYGSYSQGSTLNIRVTRASVFPSNFVIALILILLPLIWFWWKHLKFEQARQDESDVGRTGMAKVFTGTDEEED
ncbi:DUF4178 domain-containing protein [Sphingosinicella sp. LHD-64]|uniref:DUF4178 domain-containing protein n=1 Tax=Sphingosinicella sp. LHD-64 TaxID=3072139 RepID=UPI00280F93B6|nr:DUF4178 domain-containing protein [Sphingosinicella sp. LHD-64]MDQ8754619.1 DUF4178 domain-containing protein [Sphingosinicella sp. LHD-64]